MNSAKLVDICFVSCCCLFLIITIIASPISLNIQVVLLLIGSVIIGLPHGAMDYEIGKYLGLCNNLKSKLMFLTTYLAIAAINFGIWLISPIIGFGLFLILSIWHFSEDWEDENINLPGRWIKKNSFALALISLPSVLNSQDLQLAFSFLIDDYYSTLTVLFLQKLAVPMIILTTLFTFLSFKKNDYLKGLVSFLFIVSAIFLPPIIFLFLYFCILHGPRHTADLYKILNYKSFAELLRNNLAVIVATLIILMAAILFYNSEKEVHSHIFSILIILIACLTCPHMLLISMLNRKI